ncbi:unnamed protein product [marine sediment metagenome]|uniref:Uncharacterized protein n=1 Tax=marine sediment metagenome TaxID=412755 RepID=X1VGP5_9ZZZZ
MRLFSTEEVIFKKTFSHQIPYKFQYHQAKLKMFIKDYFSELARYLKDTPKKCPGEMFLSARTGIWLRNFVCGWFDEKDYFEFRPADIVLKMEKVGRGEMRKYIRQF